MPNQLSKWNKKLPQMRKNDGIFSFSFSLFIYMFSGSPRSALWMPLPILHLCTRCRIPYTSLSILPYLPSWKILVMWSLCLPQLSDHLFQCLNYQGLALSNRNQRVSPLFPLESNSIQKGTSSNYLRTCHSHFPFLLYSSDSSILSIDDLDQEPQ